VVSSSAVRRYRKKLWSGLGQDIDAGLPRPARAVGCQCCGEWTRWRVETAGLLVFLAKRAASMDVAMPASSDVAVRSATVVMVMARRNPAPVEQRVPCLGKWQAVACAVRPGPEKGEETNNSKQRGGSTDKNSYVQGRKSLPRRILGWSGFLWDCFFHRRVGALGCFLFGVMRTWNGSGQARIQERHEPGSRYCI